MNKKEARRIQKVSLNGNAVKMFEVWELIDNAWVFQGKNVAPVKVADKNLINYVQQFELADKV